MVNVQPLNINPESSSLFNIINSAAGQQLLQRSGPQTLDAVANSPSYYLSLFDIYGNRQQANSSNYTNYRAYYRVNYQTGY